MNRIVKRSKWILILVAAFFIMLSILGIKFYKDGAVWATRVINRHIFNSGNLTNAGAIYDEKGTLLVSSKDGKRIYNDDFYKRASTLHVVGDRGGLIGKSVQNNYRSSLIGYSRANGLYDIVSGKQTGVKLTINAEVCAEAYKALNGAKGAVMVYNYQTGAVECMISAPTFDPSNPPSNETMNSDSRYEAVFLNRCIEGRFTPGSVMKIVTLICALENLPDVEKRTFNCNGSLEIGGDKIVCSGTHGKQTLEKALNNSCNCAFAVLGKELGNKKLTKTLNELGYNAPVSIGKITGNKSIYSYKDAKDSRIAWAAVGRYTTLITPVHMLRTVGTIANGGVCVNPYLIEEASNVKNESGKINKNITLDPEIAKKADHYLRSNVLNFYGDNTFPNLKMTGKTGSAERGKDSLGRQLRHCWYAGYSRRSDFPYAIVVICENLTSGSGLRTAAPIANKVMQKLLSQKGLAK